MKILISVDIEGASGIASRVRPVIQTARSENTESNPDYLAARMWLTEDVNAAVEGAIEAGANEFVLHDSHGLDYRNVDLDTLHPLVEVIRGMPIIFYEYKDLTNHYDAAFLIAMHARGGQAGILSHALDWPLLREIRINGSPVGESQITAALAGYYGIPTVLITGDDVVCAEMEGLTSHQIETAVVKYSLSRYAARCLPLTTAWERIQQAAKKAVLRIGEIKPSRYELPVTLELELNDGK